MKTEIAFGEWILKSDYIRGDDMYWRKEGTDTFWTTKELFRIFNTTKK